MPRRAPDLGNHAPGPRVMRLALGSCAGLLKSCAELWHRRHVARIKGMDVRTVMECARGGIVCARGVHARVFVRKEERPRAFVRVEEWVSRAEAPKSCVGV